MCLPLCPSHDERAEALPWLKEVFNAVANLNCVPMMLNNAKGQATTALTGGLDEPQRDANGVRWGYREDLADRGVRRPISREIMRSLDGSVKEMKDQLRKELRSGHVRIGRTKQTVTKWHESAAHKFGEELRIFLDHHVELR